MPRNIPATSNTRKLFNKQQRDFSKAVETLQKNAHKLEAHHKEQADRLIDKFYRTGELSKKQWHFIRILPSLCVRKTKAPHNPGACYVYLISSTDSVKVGISANPKQRLKSLQTSHPNPLHIVDQIQFPGRAQARMFEKHIHKACRSLRRDGGDEWFAPEAESLFREFCEMERSTQS